MYRPKSVVAATPANKKVICDMAPLALHIQCRILWTSVSRFSVITAVHMTSSGPDALHLTFVRRLGVAISPSLLCKFENCEIDKACVTTVINR